METIQSCLQWFLNLGAAVFVPMIMIAAGLIVRMQPMAAVKSGITLGVAFTGMSLLIDFMAGSISPAARAITANTGISLPIVDGGWTTVATACWAWPFGFLLFPLMVVINIAMIAFKWTNTINADVLNVWGKIFTATCVVWLTGNIVLGFVAASIQIIVELLSADAHQHRIQELTNIPGVTCTHRMILTAAVMYPIDCLLKRIPALSKRTDARTIKSQVGAFAEDCVLGFLLGMVFSLFARYDLAASLKLCIQCATALTLFPVVAGYFTKALTPISEAISKFMDDRFKGRNLYVGLDWQFMGTSNEMWLAVYWNALVTLLFAMILPNNQLLPFAGIINVAIAIAAYLVTRGNLPRMLILCTMFSPVYLYAGTFFADAITWLSSSTGVVQLATGGLISNSSIEAPVFTYGLSQLPDIMHGNWLPLVVLAVWCVCFVLYLRALHCENSSGDTSSESIERKSENA